MWKYRVKTCCANSLSIGGVDLVDNQKISLQDEPVDLLIQCKCGSEIAIHVEMRPGKREALEQLLNQQVGVILDYNYERVIGGFEKQLLLSALRESDNDKGVAAKLLGMSRSSLYRLLEKHGVQ